MIQTRVKPSLNLRELFVFRKMGGGIEGRLEFIGKLIGFGAAVLPLVINMWRSWSDLSPIKISCNLLLHLRVACQAEQCPPYLDSGPIPFPGCPSRQACTPGRTFGVRNEGLFHDCEGDAVLVRHNIIINNHLWSLISKDFLLLWSSVRDFSALLPF